MKKVEIEKFFGFKQDDNGQIFLFGKKKGKPYFSYEKLTEEKAEINYKQQFLEFKQHEGEETHEFAIPCGEVINVPNSIEVNKSYFWPVKVRLVKQKDDKIKYGFEFWSSSGPDIHVCCAQTPRDKKLIDEYKERIEKYHIPFIMREIPETPKQTPEISKILKDMVLDFNQMQLAEAIVKQFNDKRNLYVCDSGADSTYSIVAAMQWVRLAYDSPGVSLIVCEQSRVDEYIEVISKCTDMELINFAASLHYRKNIKKKIMNDNDTTLLTDVFIIPTQNFIDEKEKEYMEKFKYCFVFVDSVSNIEDMQSKQFQILKETIKCNTMVILPNEAQRLVEDKEFIFSLLSKEGDEVDQGSSYCEFNIMSSCRTILCEMSPLQKQCYLDLINHRKKKFVSNQKGPFFFKLINDLIGVSTHVLYESKNAQELTDDQFIYSSGKFVFLYKMFNYIEGKYKKVIISYSEQEQYYLLLKKFMDLKGINFLSIDKKSTLDTKKAVQKLFINDDSVNVVITQGIKISGAEVAVIFSSNRNPFQDANIFSGPEVKLSFRLVSKYSCEEEFLLRTVKRPILENSTNALSSKELSDMCKISVMMLLGEDDSQFSNFIYESFETTIENRVLDLYDDQITYDEIPDDSQFFDKYFPSGAAPVVNTQNDKSKEEPAFTQDIGFKYAKMIIEKGLIECVTELLKDTSIIDPKLNASALLFAFVNMVHGDEELIRNALNIISIVSDNKINQDVLANAPFNDAQYISAIFASNMESGALLGQIIKKDNKELVLRIVSSTLKQQSVTFGYSLVPTFCWSPIVDYVILSLDEDQRYEYLTKLFPEILSIKDCFPPSWCQEKIMLITREALSAIPDDFDWREPPIAVEDFYKYHKPEFEKMPQQHIAALMRAMLLIAPEPFETLPERILANTFFTYRIEVITRYVKSIASICGYKHDADMKETTEFSSIKSNTFKVLSNTMNKMRELYLRKGTILAGLSDVNKQKSIVNYTLSNGFISICKLLQAIPDLAQGVQERDIQNTMFLERMRIKPICPPGIKGFIHEFENVEEWKKFINQAIISSTAKTSPDVFNDLENCIMYASFGDLNEDGIPIGFAAVRVIRNMKIYCEIKDVDGNATFIIRTENNEIRCTSTRISLAFAQFCVTYSEKYHICINYQAYSFFGFTNELINNIYAMKNGQ